VFTVGHSSSLRHFEAQSPEHNHFGNLGESQVIAEGRGLGRWGMIMSWTI